MEVSVKYLPFITIYLLVLTIVITLSISLSEKHIVGSIPYISDTGTKTPESCIFGQALNILWVILSFIIYVKYRQVKDILSRFSMENKKILNRTTMQVGLGACFGLSIVGNFQETNLFYVHWCGAILIFGLGAVYQCMQTVLYVHLGNILAQKNITYLRIVLSGISVTSFAVFFICATVAYRQKKDDNYLNWTNGDGGFVVHNVSVVFEWICATSTMLYAALFYWEFKKITLYEPDVFVEDNITIGLKMERANEGFEA